MPYAGNPHVRKAAVCVLSGIMAAAVFASDWYVDADNGNDGWDGTTAAIPSPEVIGQGGTIPGPRKTLHAMMSDERVQPGDVVKAAEGDYNEGGEVNEETAQTVNRVQVKAGVKLCASGARAATFISGSGGTGTEAYTNGAARCVFFLAPPSEVEYGYGIVKGFTLRDGRTAPSSTKEHGGASIGGGLLVDCTLENNGCGEAARGGTMKGGTALRCHFSSNANSYLAFSSSTLIDSLVSVGQLYPLYQKCQVYNCTFDGNAYVRGGDTYNCLFIGTGTSRDNQQYDQRQTHHNNTFSRSNFHATTCTSNETCRVVTAEETPYDATTFRPVAGSVAIDAGDMSYYVDATNGWKAAWLAECGKDYYGKDRVVNGAIDVGCGEAQEESSLTISDDSDGLVVTGAAIGTTDIPKGASIDVTFSRNFTSDRLCTGVEVNGEFHSFGGTTSDVPYAVTFSATVGGVYNIAAVYETDQKDWYVSPSGNDSNKGYHKNCPRRTLVKAMELATANAGNVVHAAAGTYNEGEAWAGSSSNRVVVAEGVGLVADDWPLQETVIQGASATAEGEADKYGNGTNAVRCAYVSSSGYVRGFKLTGGRTQRGDKTGARGGGAYLSGGALVDCELTGNGCAHRGRAAFGGTYIRCYFHGQKTSVGSYDIYSNSAVIDSFVDGTCYDCSSVLNSTFTDQLRANGAQRALNSYLWQVTAPPNSVVGMACTNCVFTVAATNAIGTGCTYDEATCKFSVDRADNLDENFRPKAAASPLVDAGSKELYDANFPSKWVQFKGHDFKYGQRIYNAQIDVGCGEYDFRADFERLLGRGVVIPVMGPGVTTNSVPNIVVLEGDSITLSMQPKGSIKTLYRLVYTPDGGSMTTYFEESEDPFLYTLEGACTVQSLTKFGCSGFTVVFR